MIIAKAVAVAGEAFAHNTMGELRVLDIGDLLMEGETVVNTDGSQVELELIDGSVVSVRELCGRKLGRELMRDFVGSEAALANGVAQLPTDDVAQFRAIADGDPVQTSAGQNLFFNEKPLYWSLEAGKTVASAIIHVNCDGEFTDQTAFQLRLDDTGLCPIVVAQGVFQVETHNIPFTTGDPQPGHPVKFFGISDGSAAELEQAVVSADVHSIGVINNWHREEDDIVFDFQGSPEVPRAINNFAFKNTGSAPAMFIARAYRSGDPDPVYEAGSEQSPLRVSAGAVFTIISQANYDRLVLAPLDGCSNCRQLSLGLEGFSEFESRDVAMSVAVTGMDHDGGKAAGKLNFRLSGESGDTPDIDFEVCAVPDGESFNSIWEQLG